MTRAFGSNILGTAIVLSLLCLTPLRGVLVGAGGLLWTSPGRLFGLLLLMGAPLMGLSGLLFASNRRQGLASLAGWWSALITVASLAFFTFGEPA